MKSLEAIIEFAALAIIGLMLLTFFENAMAANANAQASANRTNALTSLLYQTGNGILGNFGWNAPTNTYLP